MNGIEILQHQRFIRLWGPSAPSSLINTKTDCGKKWVWKGQRGSKWRMTRGWIRMMIFEKFEKEGKGRVWRKNILLHLGPLGVWRRSLTFGSERSSGSSSRQQRKRFGRCRRLLTPAAAAATRQLSSFTLLMKHSSSSCLSYSSALEIEFEPTERLGAIKKIRLGVWRRHWAVQKGMI